MTDDEVRAAAESLIGTRESKPEILEGMTPDQDRIFDDIVFECEICGWWYVTGELVNDGSMGDMVCEGCDEDA
jgi:hypothetical protein